MSSGVFTGKGDGPGLNRPLSTKNVYCIYHTFVLK